MVQYVSNWLLVGDILVIQTLYSILIIFLFFDPEDKNNCYKRQDFLYFRMLNFNVLSTANWNFNYELIYIIFNFTSNTRIMD